MMNGVVRLIVCLCLLLCLSACLDEGVWRIRGMDAALGAYEGSLEIRAEGDGTYEFIRVAQFTDYEYDGRTVDVVWTGTGRRTGDAAWTFSVELSRIGFIPALGTTVRQASDNTPLRVSVDVGFLRSGLLKALYSSPDDPALAATEWGVPARLPAAEPLWHSERERIKTHDDLGFLEELVLFDLFDGYHDLPEVRPYTNRSEFKKGVHYQIRDMTDVAYYRAFPDRLRLENMVVDEISLAETEIRANAFRAAFHEKAAYYQADLEDGLVNAQGMVLRSLDETGAEGYDVDSALWTGVYVFTQGLRYRHTGSDDALANMRRSLEGLFTLMDVTGDARTFARTLRSAGPPLAGDWRRGSGAFAGMDWLDGGNNDMSKGLLMGFLAAWEFLPADDPLRADLQGYALGLLDLCQFAEDPDQACGGASKNFVDAKIDAGDLLGDVADLPSTNFGTAALLAGLVLGDASLVNRGLGSLDDRALVEFAESGGGPFYEYGISDWSGNHLALVATLVLRQLLVHTDDRSLEDAWNTAARKAWRTLRKLDHPLHAAAALRGGTALSDPAEISEATEQLLGGLTSFPVPKHPWAVDHSIRQDFVLSPFPALPWKQDWETNSGRQQSLNAYPVIELSIDNYRWNDQHFGFRSDGLGRNRTPGVDFLFLYWLARDGGLISASD